MQKSSALNRFCLTAPILNTLFDKYGEKFYPQHCSKRKSHYQLTGSHLKRLCENVKKLTAEVVNCPVTFCDNDAVFHLASKMVLLEDYEKRAIATPKHRK